MVVVINYDYWNGFSGSKLDQSSMSDCNKGYWVEL